MSNKDQKTAYFAYLRVSTDAQDINNQKLGVMEYANGRNYSPVTFVEDRASGTLAWQERAIGELLNKTAKAGDIIILSEVSRLGRSTLQVLEILEVAAKKSISIHIVKNNLIMDGSMQATITATILGLAAHIEREFISSRTKEALAKRKAEGKQLGRPNGLAEVLKLDSQADEIMGYLKKGINKRAISKLIECAPSTLYKWLERRKIRIK